MKKLFFLSLFVTALAVSAFATDPINSNKAVAGSFNEAFANATNIEWTITPEFHRAKFTVDGQTMFAYYAENGDLIAVTRYIKVDQLPFTLASTVKEKHPGYLLADLFEVSAHGETLYYATLHKAKCAVTLQGTSSGGWKFYKRAKL